MVIWASHSFCNCERSILPNKKRFIKATWSGKKYPLSSTSVLTLSTGKAGFSATGNSTADKEQNLTEKGSRIRAVLDFGILGAVQKDLKPVDANIIFAGQTFDFTVADVTDSPHVYKAGERIDFITNYGSASFAMMNRYIPCILAEE